MRPISLWHRNIVIITSAIFALVFDQVTKYWAFGSGFGDFLNVLRPILGKQNFANYDFAFSLQAPHFVMYTLYALLIGGLVRYYYQSKDRSFYFKIAIMLIVVGALSNILDRFVYGYVRDFIFVFWGNIFNIADVYIVTGIVMLLRQKN